MEGQSLVLGLNDIFLSVSLVSWISCLYPMWPSLTIILFHHWEKVNSSESVGHQLFHELLTVHSYSVMYFGDIDRINTVNLVLQESVV